MVVIWPGGIATGALQPGTSCVHGALTLKLPAWSPSWIASVVIASLPVLVTVIGIDAVPLTATSPKSIAAGDASSGSVPVATHSAVKSTSVVALFFAWNWQRRIVLVAAGAHVIVTACVPLPLPISTCGRSAGVGSAVTPGSHASASIVVSVVSVGPALRSVIALVADEPTATSIASIGPGGTSTTTPFGSPGAPSTRPHASTSNAAPIRFTGVR